MATFRYSAYRSSGGETTGTVEAENLREATAQLRRDGLYPKEVVPAAERSQRRSFRSGVSLPQLALMTRRLATLVASAVPLFEAVSTLREQEPEGELRRVLGRVRDRLAEGAGLAAALAGDPAVFGESYVSMVAAGEASGALDAVLERTADFLEDRQAVQSRVTTALAYPIIMTVAGSGVMLFLLGFVVPKIVMIFEDNKAALPLITRILIAVSAFVRTGWWGLLAAAVAAVWGYRRLMREDRFRLRRDTVLLRLPVVGPLLQRMALSRFARVLGLLMAAGVPVIRALEITSSVVVNRRYTQLLHDAREKLAQGASLSASLAGSELFPPLLVHMVSVGEKGGEMETMLVKAGRAFEKEFETSVTRLMALLEPLLVLGMGLAVGTVVVAVLLPIFQLNQLVK